MSLHRSSASTFQRFNDLTRRSQCSRREPINLPRSIRQSRITKTIVQPIQTPLPKLQHVWFQPVTAPVWRQWNPFVTKALGDLCHARIEHTARVDDFTLARSPGTQLASDGTRMKICLRLFTRGLLHFS